MGTRKLYNKEHPVEQAFRVIDKILREAELCIIIDYIYYKGNIVDPLDTDSRTHWSTLPRSFDTERIAIREE